MKIGITWRHDWRFFLSANLWAFGVNIFLHRSSEIHKSGFKALLSMLLLDALVDIDGLVNGS